MASNVSREKLLFYAAAGALGGVAAWGLSEPILGIRWVYGRDILFGALIGALISAFLASIETLSVGQIRQAARRFVVGGIIGAVGGALGLLVGELAFDVLGGLNGRILGWGVLGIAVGLGGFFYQSLTSISSVPQAMGRAIAIIILGALIGFFIGLVGELLKRGWLMVVRSQSRNAREGREYPLTKGVTIIGRAEESDIGLFGDQSVLGSHAIIRREGKNFVISPTGGQIFVNRQPVAGRYALKSGDRLEVGGTLFLFRERAQVAPR